MRQQTIEEAAYASAALNTSSNDQFDEHRHAFTLGARWRIGYVWHDCQKELPEKEGKWILLEAESCGKTVYLPVEWENDGKGATKPMKRWAYIDDLLPETEETKEGGVA